MGAEMVVDVQEMKGRKSVKRKRMDILSAAEEREARICELREEVDSLVRYYNGEFSGERRVGLSCDSVGANNVNSTIGCLLEESSLSLSKLVGEIYEQLKGSGEGGLTPATVKSTVLMIGQRCCYGVSNPNADVLEDEDPSCLWCWETRDVKLIPKSTRAAVKIRRTCRKKIHERISAVLEVIAAFMKSESHQNCRQEVIKVTERLVKVLNETEIRLLVERMMQKNGSELAEKTVKREEKLTVKQLEKNKREAEKEKKRMDRELQKEKLQSEKELKRLQEEAEKEERRREKEESEMKKQRKKQQEEEERDQRRREKEEAELKRQLALQKQASLLERFLKKSKNNTPSQNDQSSNTALPLDKVPVRSEKMPESVAQSMDNALSLTEEVDIDEIWKSHLSSWHQLGHSIDRKRHWSTRRKPKRDVVKGLKLTASRELPSEEEFAIEKLDDGCSEMKADVNSCNTNADGSSPNSQKCIGRKQLLQFDKSHRPAFYGIWPKKSQAVRPCCPLVKDPFVDYEIDSDEEWEEEEPGESLSDCDEEERDESMEEGCTKADDEDESEDGFFVPDGYLSENEGVHVERLDCTDLAEEARSSPGCKQEVETEEFHLLFRQQKHLQNLTEHALRKNRPLVILNLMHDKAGSLLDEDLTGTPDRDHMCLQALSIRAFPVGPSIEISLGNDIQEDEENCPSSCRRTTTPVASGTALREEDLPEMVSVIRSCPHGINKLIESLLEKFPTVSKAQLGAKVREISNFSSHENRWQVKKEILSKLGHPVVVNGRGRTSRSIATFFSKRYHPPAGKTSNPTETSPVSLQKPLSAVECNPTETSPVSLQKPLSAVELQQNET